MTTLLLQTLQSLASGDYPRALRQLSAACLAESPHSPTEAKIYTVRKYLAEVLARQEGRLEPWQVDVVRIGIEARIDAAEAERAAAKVKAEASLRKSRSWVDGINWAAVHILHSALIAESRRSPEGTADEAIVAAVESRMQIGIGARASGVEWEIAIARFQRWER